MARDDRTCPIEGCTRTHSTSKLMCKMHWYMVPKHLRDELWEAYRQQGVWSEEYREARDKCIAAVEEAEAG